jgi:hypothetical protein
MLKSGFLSKKQFVGAALLAVVAAGVFYFWTRTDPREAFLREVETMVETVHAGEHTRLRSKFSPEFEEFLRSSGVLPGQILLIAQRLDAAEGRRYRITNLAHFEAGRYAEVEFERSGPHGDFTHPLAFAVPFVYQDGEWKVAGSFRTPDRDWTTPF